MNSVVKVLARSVAAGMRIVLGVVGRAGKAGRRPPGLVGTLVPAVLVLVVSLVAVPLLVSGWADTAAGGSVLLSRDRSATASSPVSATPAAGQPSTPAPPPSTARASASVPTPATVQAPSAVRLTSESRSVTGAGLRAPAAKDIAMKLVSSAENSSLDWTAQYAYIEDIGDGRGYTGGIIGFCSGTGDMLDLITRYTAAVPGNALAAYLPALRQVEGSPSHAGLDPGFPGAWRSAARDPRFRSAQDAERDDVYFSPAVGQAERDGLQELGQFIYFDAMVMHGPGSDPLSFGGIRQAAMRRARTPAQGGSEVGYLTAFLQARKAVMRQEPAHADTSRVDTAQLALLQAGNLRLSPPLRWKVYGDSYSIP